MLLKKIFLVVGFLLFIINVWSKNHVYIVLSPQDCDNCTMIMHELKNKSYVNNVTLVMPKRSQMDSVGLVKRFNLQKLEGRMIFDDAQFEFLKNNDPKYQSNVVIHNTLSDRKKVFPLIRYKEFEHIIEDAVADTWTYTMENQVFGSECISEIKRGVFYNFDKNRQSVVVYNLYSGQKNYEIELQDSHLVDIYKYRFGKDYLTRFTQMMGKIDEPESWRRHLNKMVYVQFYGLDTVITWNLHTYVIGTHSAGGPLLTDFQSMNMYKNGKLIESSIVENYFDPVIDSTFRGLPCTLSGGDSCHYGTNFAWVYDRGTLFQDVFGDFDKGNLAFKAAFKRNHEKNTYLFSYYYPHQPDHYYMNEKTFSYMGLHLNYQFHDGYAMLTYGNRLHHLLTGKTIELTHFNNDLYDLNSIISFRYYGDKVYLLCAKDNENANYYYVYDLKQQAITFSEKIIDYRSPELIAGSFFDDFDYGCIYLPTKINEFKKIRVYTD